MRRVVHFEINADDISRATKFYTQVFGWKINKWNGMPEYWLIKTGSNEEPGIDGGIMKRRVPGGCVYNIIDVPSIDEYIEKIEENGGEIVIPKTEIPDVGYVAYFKDTENNTFGIMETYKTNE